MITTCFVERIKDKCITFRQTCSKIRQLSLVTRNEMASANGCVACCAYFRYLREAFCRKSTQKRHSAFIRYRSREEGAADEAANHSASNRRGEQKNFKTNSFAFTAHALGARSNVSNMFSNFYLNISLFSIKENERSLWERVC